MTELARSETVNTEAVKYLNRLSDLLFVMSRRPIMMARTMSSGCRVQTAKPT